MAMKPISYEVNGFPEFLRSEAACQRVIERGVLKADMWVIAYGENNERKRMLASEHPLLRQLLGLEDTVKPAPEPKGEPAPPVAETPPPAVTVSVPAKPPRKKGTAEPGQPAPAEPAPLPAKTPLSPPSPVTMTALERVMAEVDAANNKRSTWQAAGIGAFVTAGLTLLIALLFTVGSNSYETRFVTLDAQVRVSPDMSASATGTVLRGEKISVENEEGGRWVRITEGPLKDGFLPVGVLASESPPALDKTQAGLIRARQELVLRNVPDPTGIEQERIAARQRMAVWGTVVGSDGAAWYLIERTASDGLPEASFARRDGEAGLSDIPKIPSIASEANPVATRTAPAQAAPASLAADREACGAIPTALPRLLCESSDLQRLDRQLRASWQEAKNRFDGAGQKVEPLNVALARIQRCRDERCARAAYAAEIALFNRTAPVTSARQWVTARTPVPRGNPGSWIFSNDYPVRALREGREGIAGFRVTVGLDGRVTNCEITQSSGHADLDQTTCILIQRRARFTPATDEYGEPAPGTFSSRVRWMVPE